MESARLFRAIWSRPTRLTTLRPTTTPRIPRRTLIAPPKPGSGPLLTRRNDRELPKLESQHKWYRTLPIFIVICTVSALAMFNYQKVNSSIVNSTMYSLRTNAAAREALGDEVYFATQWPWIWGELNQMKGRIDISFWVKGTRQRGLMRFRSIRRTRRGYFETQEWSLQLEDGTLLQLLEKDRRDPLQQGQPEQEVPAT